jgi:hypothetical protein
MNKYTKNIIWFNLEKYITIAIVASMLILTITCATSCSSNKSLVHTKPISNNYNNTCPAYK